MNYCNFLEELFSQMKTRSKLKPSESYTSYLCSLNSEAVGKKLMEESFELALSNMKVDNEDDKKELIGEAADVIYHLMALLITKNISFEDVIKKLEERGGIKKLDAINFKKNENEK